MQSQRLDWVIKWSYMTRGFVGSTANQVTKGYNQQAYSYDLLPLSVTVMWYCIFAIKLRISILWWSKTIFCWNIRWLKNGAHFDTVEKLSLWFPTSVQKYITITTAYTLMPFPYSYAFLKEFAEDFQQKQFMKAVCWNNLVLRRGESRMSVEIALIPNVRSCVNC